MEIKDCANDEIVATQDTILSRERLQTFCILGLLERIGSNDIKDYSISIVQRPEIGQGDDIFMKFVLRKHAPMRSRDSDDYPCSQCL